MTGSRVIGNFISVALFPSFPQIGGMLLMFNVIFDYFDGTVARKYNQCSFFGYTFDWFADIIAYAIILLWWNSLEPHLLLLFIILFSL